MQELVKKQKGIAIGDMPIIVTFIVVVAIVGGLGSIILKDMKESNGGTYGTDVNATLDDGVSAISELTSWLDIISLVVAATIILTLVIGVLAIFGKQGQAPGM